MRAPIAAIHTYFQGTMKALRFLTLVPAFAATAYAGSDDAKSVISGPPAGASPWRFGAAYAPIFGLETRFSGLGLTGRAFPLQPIAPGTDYNYDNGYVRVDSSGNLGGQTWNWGYRDASQVSGNTVAMSLTSSNASASAREADEIAQGIDLSAYYRVGGMTLGGREGSWGLRGGLHYGRVDIGNSSSLSSPTTIITDTFTLAPGAAMPPAPHNGSFSAPNALLGDTPTRTVSSGTGQVDGSRDLDVHLATLSLGAYLELPVTDAFSLTLEGGLNAALADGSYDFSSSTTIAGLGTFNSSGSDSGTKILPGLYLGVSGIYQINESWGVQLAGRYQYLDSFTLEDNGSQAELDFGSAFILSAGVTYRF